MEEKESLLDSKQRKPSWRMLRIFIHHNPLIALNLTLGIVGGLTCFAFTYWLSRQIFYCPSWAVNCSVISSVDTFSKHLGLVQGIVSAVHATCMSMLAYAVYQFAETMLWTFLVDQDFTLLDIENYLSHARGALPSTVLALYHSRKPVRSPR